jgi:neutral ceramidase
MRMLVLPVVVLALAGCAPTLEITVSQPRVAALPATGTPTAGAVAIDITPPPGMPMGGYSILAHRGLGFRTRLKARIVYLNDGKGDALALVQTDLTAASLLLHHRVAAVVAERTHLRPGDIAITASHSHSAPVNFFDNDFYNEHTSSGAGLEPRFLAFAGQRIAQGILEAYENRRPARVATGRKDIYGYNRNRALSSYVLNENVRDLDWEDPQAVFRAVNPALYMVRVDVRDERGCYKPLAAFSSFSVHATALTPPVQVYNADLFAYAQKDLEWAMQRKYDTPWAVVHALTNGTQGDMAPALPDRGDNLFGQFPVNWKEARELGQGIGREAISLFEALGDALTDEVTVGSAVRELDIRGHNTAEGVTLCQDAAVGNPLIAGAYERRAPWLAAVPFLRGGDPMSRRWWFFKDGCQGNKRIFGFSWLQPLLVPKDSFPHTVLFQLLRVNDTVILPLPFEVTAESGRRMAARVKREFEEAGDAGVAHVWVAGNANGYFGYTTTPEEYSRQNYEGGHTLYGQYSTPYLTAQLGLLARDLLVRGGVQELLPRWDYRLKTNTFYPKDRVGTCPRRVLRPPMPVRAEAAYEEDYIAFRWQDVGPSEIRFHEPLGRVEVRSSGQWALLSVHGEPLHDDGYDLEVRCLGDRDQGMAQYELRWYNPVPGGAYRFRIEPRGEHPALVSRPFLYRGFAGGRDARAALVFAGAE